MKLARTERHFQRREIRDLATSMLAEVLRKDVPVNYLIQEMRTKYTNNKYLRRPHSPAYG
jgi:hypothetical protein